MIAQGPRKCLKEYLLATMKCSEWGQFGISGTILENDKDLNSSTKKFIKRINCFIHECFKKIRISEKTNSDIDDLFHQRRVFRNKNDDMSKIELEKVEEELASEWQVKNNINKQ